MDSEALVLRDHNKHYEWALWEFAQRAINKFLQSLMSQFHSLEANCQTNSRKFHPSIHPSLHHLSGHYITPAQTIQYLRRTSSSRKYGCKFNICLIFCAALQCRESFLMTISWQTVSRFGKFKGQTWHKHTPYIDGTVLGTGPNGKILGPKMDRFPS